MTLQMHSYLLMNLSLKQWILISRGIRLFYMVSDSTLQVLKNKTAGSK